MNQNLRFFTESECYPIFYEEDIKFMSQFGGTDTPNRLIEQRGNDWKINFVGEVKTPNATYFSFPKNVFYQDIENKDKLISDLYKILERFSKDDTGRSLIIKVDGDFSTHRYYFELLKKYFLDYVTYEFIYPSETKKIHSNYALDGEISVIDTFKNRKMYGSGVTYLVKNLKNSDEWMLDDIYFYTLQNLKNKLGISEKENRDLENMFEYILSSGHKINKIEDNKIFSENGKELLDMSNENEVLKKIKDCDVDIIHLPIKNALLKYYEKVILTSSYNSVNFVFTSHFERVWENIIQQALGCNTQTSRNFKKEIETKYKNFEIEETIQPVDTTNEYINMYPPDGKQRGLTKWSELVKGRWRLCSQGRRLMPDVFVELEDRRRFIGDAKYYTDTNSSDFTKEIGDYNDAQNNLYPMVIFSIPNRENINKTTIFPSGGYRRRENSPNELIVIGVCVQDIIDDALNNTSKVLSESINIIHEHTRRKNWQ